MNEEFILVLIVIFIPFVFTIIVTLLQSNERRKRYQLQVDLYIKALEQGHTLPTEWLAEPLKKRNSLKTGLICIAVGIGVSLFIGLGSISMGHVQESGFPEFAKLCFSFTSLGIIPFLIGIAYVIIHFIERKKTVNKDEQ